MPNQGLDYGQLVERALKQVVRDALSYVAEHGLPGKHHLYITFRTDHPAVELADALLARYPAEMTIVLQHEFWALEVEEQGFSVTLSFAGAPQRIRVPFEAVKVFADPSVEFGLQFTVHEPANRPHALTEKPLEQRPEEAPSADAAATAGEQEADAGGSAEVVSLDRFRKS